MKPESLRMFIKVQHCKSRYANKVADLLIDINEINRVEEAMKEQAPFKSVVLMKDGSEFVCMETIDEIAEFILTAQEYYFNKFK